ncbi:MAG: DUF4249 domain-containing protein [Pontibacter sp.]|nr:DUF4249 domain-containing protein [Pontibacter sp.]
MATIRRYYSALGLLAIALFGCEMEQEVEVPQHETKMALHLTLSNLGADAEKPYLNSKVFEIGKSQGVLQESKTNDFHVKNASIKIYDAAGQVVQEFKHYDYGQQDPQYASYSYTYKEPFAFVPGHSYTLKVEAPGLKPIEATTVLPSLPVVSNTGFSQAPPTDETGTWLIAGKLQLTLEDAPGKENYYRVVAFPLTENYGWYGGYAYAPWNDEVPFVEQDNLELGEVFTDELYPSGKINFAVDILFGAEGYNPETQERLPHKYLEVHVQQLSKDEYLYLKSAREQQQNENNPFAEYINVHSNIKNGYGTFGSTAVTKIMIPL